MNSFYGSPVSGNSSRHKGMIRPGKVGEYDLRWVLLPNSFLKSGGLLFLERQFELDW